MTDPKWKNMFLVGQKVKTFCPHHLLHYLPRIWFYHSFFNFILSGYYISGHRFVACFNKPEYEITVRGTVSDHFFTFHSKSSGWLLSRIRFLVSKSIDTCFWQNLQRVVCVQGIPKLIHKAKAPHRSFKSATNYLLQTAKSSEFKVRYCIFVKAFSGWSRYRGNVFFLSKNIKEQRCYVSRAWLWSREDVMYCWNIKADGVGQRQTWRMTSSVPHRNSLFLETHTEQSWRAWEQEQEELLWAAVRWC